MSQALINLNAHMHSGPLLSSIGPIVKPLLHASGRQKRCSSDSSYSGQGSYDAGVDCIGFGVGFMDSVVDCIVLGVAVMNWGFDVVV